jgi:hypothetical protein
MNDAKRAGGASGVRNGCGRAQFHTRGQPARHLPIRVEPLHSRARKAVRYSVTGANNAKRLSTSGRHNPSPRTRARLGANRAGRHGAISISQYAPQLLSRGSGRVARFIRWRGPIGKRDGGTKVWHARLFDGAGNLGNREYDAHNLNPECAYATATLMATAPIDCFFHFDTGPAAARSRTCSTTASGRSSGMK